MSIDTEVPTKGSDKRRDVIDINPRLERNWFEFDRKAVLRQIDTLQDAIDQNARELGMVADEGVFEQSLSSELSRASRALQAMRRELKTLRGEVARASGYPRANGGSRDAEKGS